VIAVAVRTGDLFGYGAERLVFLTFELEAIGQDVDLERFPIVDADDHTGGNRHSPITINRRKHDRRLSCGHGGKDYQSPQPILSKILARKRLRTTDLGGTEKALSNTPLEKWI
jgi:hypothetical protein